MSTQIDVLEFTDQNFATEVLDKPGVALVDVWAPWCMPCRAIAPTIEELAADFAGRARIGKLDSDQNRQVPMDLQVNSIPTLLLYKDGELKERFVGLVPKAKLTEALESLLN